MNGYDNRGSGAAGAGGANNGGAEKAMGKRIESQAGQAGVRKLLADYILQHELKGPSEVQMDRILNVFLNWLSVDDLPANEFTADKICHFLAAKQREGKSSHYRRSLRCSLKALYRYGCGQMKITPGEIRPVKLEELEPQSWTTEEVAKLVEACDFLPYFERSWWRTFILVGYYSGMNAADIHRIERKDIQPAGGVPFRRGKTGKRVYFALPLDVVDEILAFAPQEGPIWPLMTSDESFRKRFLRLVRLSKIRPGTFKKLRKTSGTLVEAEHPGSGHQHLGNERKIFEQHYEDQRVTRHAVPTMPAVINLRSNNPGKPR